MNRITLSGNIMWIEDESDVREFVSLVLTSHGATVQSFATGQEALEDYRPEAVDVVLTDFQMPTMTGAEVISRIRETDPHTPVILVTGQRDLESLVSSFDHELFAILPKPFNAVQLIDTVKRGIRHKRQVQTLVNGKEGTSPSQIIGSHG